MLRKAMVFAGSLVLAALGCVENYEDPEPPSLSDAPAIESDDALVFERDVSWWSGPRAQRIRMVERADGSWLLLRERWDGAQTYAWAEGSLTEAGEQRLAEARAAFDPDSSEPAAGEYGCTYRNSLPAAVFVDGVAYEYVSSCPPEGWAELVEVVVDLSELLLDCPLDPSWYAGELPLVQGECEVAS